MEDSKILDLFWQRKEKAIVEIEKKYGKYCAAVAGNILWDKEDIGECLNDTWFRAWNGIPPEKPRNLRMYLAKITRNLAIDKYRNNTAQKRGGTTISAVLDELEECIASVGDVEQEMNVQQLGYVINSFLFTPPKRDAQIFIRRYFYVEDIAVIAKGYGIQESNVHMILHRTRKKLKAVLIKEGYLYEERRSIKSNERNRQ